MASPKILTFSPSMPIPHVFDPAKRLQDLKNGLNPQNSFYYFVEGQHPNIRAVIQAYESGVMALGSTTYFKGGKVVSEAEANKHDDFVWKEYVGFRDFQMANEQLYLSRPNEASVHKISLN